MMKGLPGIAVFCLIIGIISGCGIYSFNPGGKSSIKTISVAQFENKTIESGLANRMTDLVVDAFIADGNLKIASEDNADANLFGTLLNYKRDPYTYDEADNVSQYVVRLTFDVLLQKRESGEEIWKEVILSEGVYNVDSQTEEDGQVLAAGKLVEDIINRTTKSW
nr:hypothetical protein [candidate division Zixibacteria bacterium]